MPTRRTALLLAAAALLPSSRLRAGNPFPVSEVRRKMNGMSEPETKWIHPALAEYDAITEVADKEGCTEVAKRLIELRPQIEYLASLDPRE